MNRSEAENLARMEIIGNFKLVDAWSYKDEAEESEVTIRLSSQTDHGLETIPVDEEAGVFYLTFGWDNTTGDGLFNVTIRVTDEGFLSVVDFVASEDEDV